MLRQYYVSPFLACLICSGHTYSSQLMDSEPRLHNMVLTIQTWEHCITEQNSDTYLIRYKITEIQSSGKFPFYFQLGVSDELTSMYNYILIGCSMKLGSSGVIISGLLPDQRTTTHGSCVYCWCNDILWNLMIRNQISIRDRLFLGGVRTVRVSTSISDTVLVLFSRLRFTFC